jgi:hypothetical protein
VAKTLNQTVGLYGKPGRFLHWAAAAD